MQQAFAAARGERLVAILHLAGEANLRYIDKSSEQHSLAEFNPKVLGAASLQRCLQALPSHLQPNVVVLFSSMAAILGGFGMSAYSAANNVLDSLARAQASSLVPHLLTLAHSHSLTHSLSTYHSPHTPFLSL